MTVRDLVDLFGCGLQMIRIYDFKERDNVWVGYDVDLPDKYEDHEILSLDIIAHDILTINIDTTEED